MLLSDRSGEVRKQYGVPATLGLLPGRVTFVIDKKGIVRRVFNSQFLATRHVSGGARGARKRDADARPALLRDPAELLAPATIEDPHPFFTRVRAQHAISRVGDTGVHLVATWDLIEAALAREADFSANLTGVLVRGDDGQPAALELPATGANQVIATADEPSQRCTARSRNRARAAAESAELEPKLRAWARGCARAVARRRRRRLRAARRDGARARGGARARAARP